MISDLTRAVRRCSKPETVALLVVKDSQHNRVNIMPLGWKMWTSAQPRQIAFAVAADHFSYELLKREGECTLVWPGPSLLEGIIACGSVSGRETDKLALTGWRLLPAESAGPGLLAEGAVNLECRVEQTVVTGDHTLFICSVMAGHVGNDDTRPVFTLNDEALFKHAGLFRGYKFGTFT
jgi:flavin reductase (DIM6/NTAB) family NADH-FMN oxidoreductase RutF